MSWFVRKRSWMLALALLAAVGAALHARDRTVEAPARIEAAAETQAPSSRRADARPSSAAAALPQVEIDRLDGLPERRRGSPASADPFPAEPTPEQREAAARAAAAAAPPPPPPPPQAPAVPFRFVGAQEADGVQLVFLEQQQQVHIARTGEVVADGWRLDKLTERSVIFTYVPLNQQRTIPIGGPG